MRMHTPNPFDMGCMTDVLPPVGHRPDPPGHEDQYLTQVRLLQLMDASGYPMEQYNGQRRTGPPKDWKGEAPGQGCEIFIGKIPRDLFEDELLPILLELGKLYDLRLMMDFSGTNRGFAFAQFSTPDEAERAVQCLDGYTIRPGKHLGVMMSLDNRRLFVGGLPKTKTRSEIWKELSKLVEGIVDVILYASVVDKKKNRGFAFVEFNSHREAAIARRKMIPGGVKLWDHDLAVDWAEPEPEVSKEIMSQVKVLYMRNLELQTTEATIIDIIVKIAQIPKSAIERVKKMKDFAFIHFSDRSFAEKALVQLNNFVIDGVVVTVMWAKPPRESMKVKNFKTHRDSCSSDDESATPKGRPILPASKSQPLSVQPSYRFWNSLINLCRPEEPLAQIITLNSVSKHHGFLYMATVKVRFGSFQGEVAGTPELALESAAEKIVMFVYNNGLQSPPVHPYW